MRIILNRIKTPDGTVLTSYTVHDAKYHTDTKTGEVYGVDGGNDYLKRTGKTEDCEELSISVDEDRIEEQFDLIRENLHWGSRGKNGDQELTFIPLKHMTDYHLHQLLHHYTGNIPPFHRRCFYIELESRRKGTPGTNNTIWKYPLERKRMQVIEMSKGATIISCKMQGGLIPCIWAMANSFQVEKEERKIEIIGTGKFYEPADRRFIDTIQIHEGEEIYHVFELL